MDISKSLPSTPSSLSFSFLTTTDLERISVKQIVNPTLFDNLNRPTQGGLYDPALGPMERGDVCASCRLSSFDCPGHFGHIALPTPVYHPLFFPQAYALIRQCCMFCHRFRGPAAETAKFVGRLTLLDHGLLAAALELGQFSTMPKLVGDAPAKTAAEKEAEPAETELEKADADAESEDQFVARVEQFVADRLAELAAGASGSARDKYKDDLVYNERRRVISEFSKKGYKKCNSCKAFAHVYRKEGHTKIVELEMVAKQAAIHRMQARVRPNVLALERKAQADVRAAAAAAKKAEEDEEDEGYAPGSASEGSGSSDDGQSSGDEDDSAAVDVEDRLDAAAQADDGRAPSRDAAAAAVRKRAERVMPCDEARAHLRLLFKNEAVVCALLYGGHGQFAAPQRVRNVPRSSPYASLPPASADIFFMQAVPVPPTRFRPASKMGDIVFENPQNDSLLKILQTSFRVRDLNLQMRAVGGKPSAEGGMEVEPLSGALLAQEHRRVYGMLLDSVHQLQVDVNSFMDSSKNPTIIRGGGAPPPGVKQVLEKKEGLFRKHMMGKRVNYAARSVISPDVNLETNEIGVPPVFARKLTFPEPVTVHNISQMRQAVINGPSVYPGASMVVNEDGAQISLDKMSVEQRTALANQLLTPQDGAYTTGGLSTRTQAINKKVFRHLRDGDMLILNRQPTLHKPSMMAHKAKVLLGEKTIRMHYANCNSYNADFDGDEMNIHFAQSQVARAEGYNIANTDSQYLVPTSGAPLRGLIQDHVVAGVWMCNKNSFFTREQYFQLLYGSLRTEDDYTATGKIVTLPPTVWKPQPLWTGKQILSTVLLNIKPLHARGLNLQSKNKVKSELWGPHSHEGEVLFVDGELLIGVLDKSQFGASSYGLVHSCFEIYGPETAGKLLSVLSRLFSKFLQNDAFSCRMDDLVLTPAGEQERKQMLANVDADGKKVAINYVGLGDADPDDPDTNHNLQIRLEEILRDDRLMAGLDNVMQARFGGTTSKVNSAMVPHRLVKAFPVNNMQMMTVSGAKGSTTNATMISSVLGQQSLEGRRVPTMVSGKTLPSFRPFETAARAGGYVANRFLTGIRPQEYYFHCMSGREGLIDTAVKTSRSGYLQRCLIKHLEGIRVHYDHTVRDSDGSVVQFLYGEDGLDVTKQAHLDPKQFSFNIANSESLLMRHNGDALAGRIDDETAPAHMKKALKRPLKYDPALSKYAPQLFFGSTGETYAKSVEDYLDKNKDQLIVSKKKKDNESAARHSPWGVDKNRFKTMMNLRYIKALIDPGEAVGLLAAQGVGEPSTQMTLNTFHLAGHGAANVTLGIPRLRELVMTASSKPKTPSMKLPIFDHVSEEDLSLLSKDLKKVTLSELVDKVTVTEKLSSKSQSNGYSRARTYTVLLDFFPREEILEEHNLTPQQIFESLPGSFALHIKNEVFREIKEFSKMVKNDLEGLGKGKSVKVPKGAVNENVDGAPAADEGDDDVANDSGSDAGNDGDADDAKRAANAKEVAGYDDDSDSDSDADLEDLDAAFSDKEDDKDEDEDEENERIAMAARVSDFETRFIHMAKYVASMKFDLKQGKSMEFELQFPGDSQKLLIVDVMERCCRKAIVHQVTDISRAIRLKTGSGDDESWEHGKRTLLTEGSNFQSMWEHAHQLVDLNYIRSNDIASILNNYGVEAARASIIREVSDVFGVYAITINYRHLSLIADYMTHEGGYKPFNRTGISSKSSPLLKASFETTAAFLSDATLHGDFDNLSNPSSSIVMGKPGSSGTGVFDVLTSVIEMDADEGVMHE